jgi:hypothetical protein
LSRREGWERLGSLKTRDGAVVMYADGHKCMY